MHPADERAMLKPRKRHVQIKQDAILTWLRERDSATLREIAEHFDISKHSARRNADGLVAQGELAVESGSRIGEGSTVTSRRYTAIARVTQGDED